MDETIRSVGLFTLAYHNFVPSFGEWGYIIAYTGGERKWFDHLPSTLKYLDRTTAGQLFSFPDDMKVKVKLEPNRLNNQVLVNYFEDEWGKYLE